MTRQAWVTLIAMLVLAAAAPVPGIEAAPTTINQCQEIPDPGSYVLGKNLTVSGNRRGGLDCLRLGSDFITIDLRGFTITGSGGRGSGIRLSTDFSGSGRGFEIHNGTILNFARGIDLRVLGGSPGKNVVEHMRVIHNSEFGVVMTGVAIVKDSILFSNGACPVLDGCPAPTASGDGINVGPDSVVTGNTSIGNTGTGILVGGGSTVIGNSATGNTTAGIAAGGESTLVNNTAAGNGIGLSVVCPGNVVGNTAAGNGQNLALIGDGCNTEHNVAP